MEELKPEKRVLPCNVAPELFAAWKSSQRRGDVEAMATALGYSVPVIRNALKYGYVAQPQLPGVITKYFEERLEAERTAGGKLQNLSDQAKPRKKQKVKTEVPNAE